MVSSDIFVPILRPTIVDFTVLLMIETLILVTAFTEESFKKINGYSNEYWGWGGEDDDISHRMYEVYRNGFLKPKPV